MDLCEKGFCLFSKPGSTEIHLVQNDDSGQGQEFVFAPFDPNGHSIRFRNPAIHVVESQDLSMSFRAEAATLNPNQISKDQYQNFIRHTQKKFDNQQLVKVIAARNLFVERSDSFDPLQTFKTLLASMPQALCYLFYSPESGMWMGATPEVLLKMNKDQVQTMSLAGTKSQEMQWTGKEIEEQEIVTRFICDELVKLGAENVKVQQKRELQSSHIQHLCNDITASIKNVKSRVIADRLHPTPAVSGYKKEAAIELIQEMEGFDRSFYAGYLGLISDDSADLYVNLRCLRMGESHLELFAGAGITKDSDPDLEFAETKAKLQTLLQFVSD